MFGKPRYPASASKALEAILWLAERSNNQADVYRVVKAMFFADKWHVSNYGRPILGDTYRAATWGPLGQVVYNLLRKQPFEVLALGGNGHIPFSVDKNSYLVKAERGPNLNLLSRSDILALEHGWEAVRGKSFSQLVRETHDDPAWLRSEGDMMDYRDFLSDDEENVDLKRERLAEDAAYSYF